MNSMGIYDKKFTIPYLHSPSISYNGEKIAFSYTGDIWIASADGGDGRMITSHNGYDDRPRFSPDGSRLAFTSKRSGNGDIYVISFETEDIQQLTYHDSGDILDCWSPDGQWLYFNSGRDTTGNAAYKVSIDGGTPIRIAGDPLESYYNLAISPDGMYLAFNNNGDPWWRHGPNLFSSSEIWIVGEGIGSRNYRRITNSPGRNMWPMWDSIGRGLYFVSDRDGQENIWYQNIQDGETEQITHFQDGRLLRPSISGNGKWIVFERDFRIWKLNLETYESVPLNITVRTDKKVHNKIHRVYNGDISELELSRDGKKIIFVNRGKVFAASAEKGTEKGRPAFRISSTSSRDGHVSWNPDGNKAVYVSDRYGENHIFLYDFKQKKEFHLTSSSVPSNNPKFSPDGKWIAYSHGKEEIRLINSENYEIKAFIKGIFTMMGSPDFSWSPDSKWIAFISLDDNYFSNLYVQKLDESEPRQITFLSHIGGSGVLWSPDGKYIIFNTAQYRSEWQIARVDLMPVKTEFREEEFDKLFEEEKKENNKDKKDDGEKKDEKKKEPEPVEIEFQSIKHRLSFLTSHQLNANALCISPDSKILIFQAYMNGKPTLWSICFDEDRKDDPPKQLVSSSDWKWDLHFVQDGKKIYYLDGGKVNCLKIADNGGKDGDPKAIETRAEMDIDNEVEKMQMFNEAWKLIRDNFYDPGLHGVDWNTIREQFLPAVQGIKTQEDFHDILNLMVGELNASHLGAGGGGGGVNDSYLGVDFDWFELEKNGRFKISYILPDSPASLAREPLKIGDYILAIDGTRLDKSVNIWNQLKHKARKRVFLTVNSKPEIEGARTVQISPINIWDMGNLYYNNWVRGNGAYVHEHSGGRLGYVHIREMSYEAYAKFLVDLDTETHNKEGVVVDVRYNGGGHIASFILDVLRKRSYLYSVYRDRPPTSATNLAGNRILEKPTILVQNEHSGSNTEMFSEEYRRFGLGKVVGTPTAGAVIWTTNRGLLDGTWFRVPFIRVATIEGQNLEGTARTVDIWVERPLGEAAKGKDSQLDVAIDHLMRQIGQ